MKKILLGVLSVVVLGSIGFVGYNYYDSNKRPACNSEEVNEELIKVFEREFDKTTLSLDSFSVTNITQRPSKVSDSTNVCSGMANIHFSYFGYASNGGEVKITYTAQKTLDNKVMVDVYTIGSKDIKQLND